MKKQALFILSLALIPWMQPNVAYRRRQPLLRATQGCVARRRASSSSDARAAPADPGQVDLDAACLGDQNVFLYLEPQVPDLRVEGNLVVVHFGTGQDGLPNQIEAHSLDSNEWSAAFAPLGLRSSLVPGVYPVNSNNVQIIRHGEGVVVLDGEFEVLELKAVPYDGGPQPRELDSITLTFHLGELRGCLHVVNAKEL